MHIEKAQCQCCQTGHRYYIHKFEINILFDDRDNEDQYK